MSSKKYLGTERMLLKRLSEKNERRCMRAKTWSRHSESSVIVACTENACSTASCPVDFS